MITKSQRIVKRIFDLIFSLVLLPILFIPILVLVILASIDTGQFGLFSQIRVGQHGQLFKIYKIRTLKEGKHQLGYLELSATRLGRFLRRSKLDELPQLFNVIFGHMSFVGPRPDIQGFADELQGDDRYHFIS